MDIEEYIQKNVEPSFKIQQFPFKIKVKKVKHGTIITDYGEIENNIYFIKSGIIQSNITYKKHEKILDFFFKDNFFCSYASLLSRKPSEFQLSAIGECEINVIDFNEVAKVIDHSLIVNRVLGYENIKINLKRLQREKDFLLKSPVERYIDFLNKNKAYINNFSINKIASHPSIHPESLSRIRKRLNT